MDIVPKWIRPAGPLNVWKVVDGYETLEDGTRKPVKFSIQDVPNDEKRRQEVINLMHKYYLAEEPCWKSLKMKDNDPIAVQDIKKRWKYSLDQGVTIACYKLGSDGEIGELVGANILFIKTPENMDDFVQLKKSIMSSNYMKCVNIFEYLFSKADICKTFNVDRYITSISMSVSPAFRGQNLAVRMMDARMPMAEKYGFTITASVFTAKAGQIQAERAGFKECISVGLKELVDDEGNPRFPNIESKYVKLMVKNLP